MIARAARVLLVAAAFAVLVASSIRSADSSNQNTLTDARHLVLSTQGSCLDCHSRAEGVARDVIALHSRSVHGAFRCEACHGGDPSSSDKARSHSGTWVGVPTTAGLLKMCGSCHTEQPEQYRSGKHGLEKVGAQRPVCTSCHGVHTIGSPPESFSFATYCAGCHGLEYLPRYRAIFNRCYP